MKIFKVILSLMLSALVFGGCSAQIGSKNIDVDLSKLSSTMLYSEVYNMISEPEKYIGKTVRIKGNFQSYDGIDKTYYACVIPDATACCQQGLEFRLKKEISADEYPEQETEIIVTGTFSTYNEGELQYVELIDCTMKEAEKEK